MDAELDLLGASADGFNQWKQWYPEDTYQNYLDAQYYATQASYEKWRGEHNG